jgi:hypothetical protein
MTPEEAFADNPFRLYCREHGHVGDVPGALGTPALRGIARVWCCPACSKPLVTWGPDDWMQRFEAAYPDRSTSTTTTETTTLPDGSVRVVTTTTFTPGPKDWTDLDQHALAALAVRASALPSR